MSTSSSSEIVQNSDDHYQLIGGRKTYPCRFCSRTFPTPMAVAGHHNVHKVRAHHTNLTFGGGASSVNPFSSPEIGARSIGHHPSFARPSFVKPTMESFSYSPSSNSGYLERYIQQFNPETSHRPLAPLAHPPPPPPPSPPTKSTMFFGVPDFFKPSVPPTKPLQDKISASPLALLAPPPPTKSSMFFGKSNVFETSVPPTNPPRPATSTMFFGVSDFFKPYVAPTNPLSDGASTSIVDIVKGEDEDEDLDLDLKL